MTNMQATFTILITLQFLVVIMHDWLDLPGWTHGRQVRATIGTGKLMAATIINGLFPALAVLLAIRAWQLPRPSSWAAIYWLVYCAITLGSAVMMWYVPYLFGASERTTQAYAQMYAGTRQVLPPRGDNPRPNLLHVCFHVLFVANLALAIGIWMRR